MPLMLSSALRDVTPQPGTSLGGMVAERREAKSVTSRLYVSVAVINPNERQPPLVIVTFDLLYVGPGIIASLRSAFPQIPEHRWILAASHTHQAPMTDAGKPGLGALDAAYMDLVASAARAAVGEALASVRPGRLIVSTGSADLSVNRRRRVLVQISSRPRMFKAALAPRPNGPRDETVCSLRFEDTDGTPIAVIWNYASHPVGHPDTTAVDAHYPGPVRDAVRSALGDSRLPVLFLQGFSGNVRPRVPRRNLRRETLVALLTGRRGFRRMTSEEYTKWTDDLSRVVTRHACAPGTSVEGTLESWQVPRDTAAEPRFSVSVVDLGVLRLVCANGEMMAEWALELREHRGELPLIPVGCVGDCIGYVPTEEMLPEGGYEAADFLRYFPSIDISRSSVRAMHRMIRATVEDRSRRTAA